MKKILFLLTTVLLLSACNGDDDQVFSPTPVSQLPPETQTGANTFGCLLDGVIFKPGFYPNSYQCFYQFVNGGYFFYVSANETSNNVLSGISIGTEKLQISQGQTFNLYERIDGNAFGALSNLNDNTGIYQINTTSTAHTGELKITKLDFANGIVSGTFWYILV